MKPREDSEIEWEKQEIQYSLINPKKYNNKVINIYHNPKMKNIDDISFDFEKNIILKRKGKIYVYTLNNFITLLIKNHLSDKSLYRKMIKQLNTSFLKFIFG